MPFLTRTPVICDGGGAGIASKLVSAIASSTASRCARSQSMTARNCRRRDAERTRCCRTRAFIGPISATSATCVPPHGHPTVPGTITTTLGAESRAMYGGRSPPQSAAAASYGTTLASTCARARKQRTARVRCHVAAGGEARAELAKAPPCFQRRLRRRFAPEGPLAGSPAPLPRPSPVPREGTTEHRNALRLEPSFPPSEAVKRRMCGAGGEGSNAAPCTRRRPRQRGAAPWPGRACRGRGRCAPCRRRAGGQRNAPVN